MNSFYQHDPDDILRFIIRYKEENDGCAPSTREIMKACEISSSNLVRQKLGQLEKAGLVSLGKYRQARFITITGGKWVYDDEGA